MRGLVGFISGYFGTYALYGIYAMLYDFKPLWAKGSHPLSTENISVQKWENNIVDLMKNYVDKSNLSLEQKQKAIDEARTIAKNYVSNMQNRADMLNILTNNNNIMYGISNRGTISAWSGNWGNQASFCSEWAVDAKSAVSSDKNLEFWTATVHFDYSPMGDTSLGFFFRHSFVSIQLKDQNEPAFILDAWITAYPEVYSPESYFNYFGKGRLGKDE
ncbi:MAG: hypothetical protein LBP59_17780 [Planctomycetaceae bacterium]|nr:hypothetical protein [Planctomycetaceae bacterium]